eukprot:Filipodium_phascolosomae@DN4594_c0_g1_i1.p1
MFTLVLLLVRLDGSTATRLRRLGTVDEPKRFSYFGPKIKDFLTHQIAICQSAINLPHQMMETENQHARVRLLSYLSLYGVTEMGQEALLLVLPSLPDIFTTTEFDRIRKEPIEKNKHLNKRENEVILRNLAALEGAEQEKFLSSIKEDLAREDLVKRHKDEYDWYKVIHGLKAGDSSQNVKGKAIEEAKRFEALRYLLLLLGSNRITAELATAIPDNYAIYREALIEKANERADMYRSRIQFIMFPDSGAPNAFKDTDDIMHTLWKAINKQYLSLANEMNRKDLYLPYLVVDRSRQMLLWSLSEELQSLRESSPPTDDVITGLLTDPSVEDIEKLFPERQPTKLHWMQCDPMSYIYAKLHMIYSTGSYEELEEHVAFSKERREESGRSSSSSSSSRSSRSSDDSIRIDSSSDS